MGPNYSKFGTLPLKGEINAKSYDEVIRYLFVKAKRMETSHFGSLPKLESFEREEIDRLRG
jgi:hypothetical protein